MDLDTSHDEGEEDYSYESGPTFLGQEHTQAAAAPSEDLGAAKARLESLKEQTTLDKPANSPESMKALRGQESTRPDTATRTARALQGDERTRRGDAERPDDVYEGLAELVSANLETVGHRAVLASRRALMRWQIGFIFAGLVILTIAIAAKVASVT